MADISQFYEHINPMEYVRTAIEFGIPKSIVVLIVHLYLAPRRLRVKGSYSARAYPRRSIWAGCTWATALIRIMMIPHVDAFLRQAQQRIIDTGVNIKLTAMVYVDDVLAMTTGSAHQVARFHAWVTKALLVWVRDSLHKKVAWNKLQVVAPMDKVRDTLRSSLPELMKKVSGQGELLGSDFTAGGQMRARPISRKRLRKAFRRRRRLKWLREMGEMPRRWLAGTSCPPSLTWRRPTVSRLPSCMAFAESRLR